MSSTSTLPNPHLHAQMDAPPPSLSLVKARATHRYRLQFLLFCTTLLTTTLIGMRYMSNFEAGQNPLTSQADIFPFPWAFENLAHFSDGLPFALTLIAILLAHEFAHYAACRYFNIDASLPFILPAPTLSGTVGAVIRLRSRINSRRALMLVGASGPIAGFSVAVVTTCWGLIHSVAITVPQPPSLLRIGAPGLIPILRSLLLPWNPEIPGLYDMVPHPVLVASWIGLLITSVNLIPAGQLDGGHILYAISPRAHRVCTHLSIGILLYLGTLEWIGWLFWAFLLMLPTMKHPRVRDKSQLGLSYLALAPMALVIFAVTFSTQPCVHMSLVEVLTHINWGLWIR